MYKIDVRKMHTLCTWLCNRFLRRRKESLLWVMVVRKKS
nr:MAG TPA: hypothetical protein [Caudoviricetes sp.]